MQIVVVEWRDSRMYLEQCPVDSEWEACVITSVGHLVEDTKERVVLAGDHLDEDVRRVIVIPRENVVSMKEML